MAGVHRTPIAPPLLAAALWALAGPIHAAHPLISDDTATQGSGNWQLEANTDHTRTREAGIGVWEREANLQLTHGVAEALDVMVNLPWLYHSESDQAVQRGIGDLTLLAKWRFHDNGRGWTLGLRPELTLPSGSESRGLGNGRATASLTLLSQLESGAWTWLANAGYTYNDNRAGDRKHLWAASTALLYAVGEQWTLAADIGTARAADVSVDTERYGLLGVICHLGRDIDLDVGWRRSLGAGPIARTLGAGLTLRW